MGNIPHQTNLSQSRFCSICELPIPEGRIRAMPQTTVCVHCADEFKANDFRTEENSYHKIDPSEFENTYELDKEKDDRYFLLTKSIALCSYIEKVFEVVEGSGSSQAARHLLAYKHGSECNNECYFIYSELEWIVEIPAYDTVLEFKGKKELNGWLKDYLREYDNPNILVNRLGIK